MENSFRGLPIYTLSYTEVITVIKGSSILKSFSTSLLPLGQVSFSSSLLLSICVERVNKRKYFFTISPRYWCFFSYIPYTLLYFIYLTLYLYSYSILTLNLTHSLFLYNLLSLLLETFLYTTNNYILYMYIIYINN